MDANHQDTANNNLTTTNDVEWVVSKKSKLFIPQHKHPRKKTFKVPFDWLNLIGVLLIPFVVTVIGLYATQQITQEQAQASEKQHQTDLQIANDQQQEVMLETYLDRMSDLLLNYKLAKSKQGDVVRDVARARTLEVLLRVNAVRKGAILQFLDEAGLIRRDTVIIDLYKANFSTIYWPYAWINFINLSGVDLSHANLYHAFINDGNLSNTNLSNADLRGVEMDFVNLEFANLHGADLHDPEANVNPNLVGEFPGPTMQEADLIFADLSDADLRYVDLFGDNLSHANLKGANLLFAILRGADLSNADLRGAKVTYGQLAQAKSLKGAIMPDGTIHP